MPFNDVHISILREIKILKELQHENVIRIHEVFQSQELMFLVMEYGHTNVGDFIRKKESLQSQKQQFVLTPACIKNLM
jgi:serine/threonine protein kinase